MRKAIVILVSVMLAAMGVYSQAPRKDPAALAKEDATLKKRKAMAVYMIERTAQDAPTWKDRKLAAEALIDAARLLWTENQVKAAARLKLAWQMAEGFYRPANKNGKLVYAVSPPNSEGKEIKLVDPLSLRNQILSVALDNDRRLFEGFIKQIPIDQFYYQRTDNPVDRELLKNTARNHHFFRLAYARILEDPKLAFDLVSRTLTHPISSDLTKFLTDLRGKDAEIANRLFDLAAAGLKNSDMDGFQALSNYLFRAKTVAEMGDSFPARARAFLFVIYKLHFATTDGFDLPKHYFKLQLTVNLAERLRGEYAKYAPELLRPVENFFELMHPKAYPNGKPTREHVPATIQEQIEAIIVRGEGEGDREGRPSVRNEHYRRTAHNASWYDLPRAIRIAEKIDDEILREKTISYLNCRIALYQFLRDRKFDEAEAVLPMFPDAGSRRMFQIAIVQVRELTPAADANLTRQKAYALMTGPDPVEASSENIGLLFGTAVVAAKYDRARAFVLIEGAIEMMNKVPDHPVKKRSAPAVKFEVKGQFSETIGGRPTGFGFRDVVDVLIDADFERLLNLIEGLSDPAKRGTARIEVAKVLLDKHKPVPVKPKK